MLGVSKVQHGRFRLGVGSWVLAFFLAWIGHFRFTRGASVGVVVGLEGVGLHRGLVFVLAVDALPHRAPESLKWREGLLDGLVWFSTFRRHSRVAMGLINDNGGRLRKIIDS